MTSGPDPGELPGFWGSMVFRHSPISRKGSGKQQQQAEADEFLTKLNCLHPSLKFTFEKEKGKCLPFLDVYVERTDVGLETSVYRKPTFTG